MTRTPEGFGRGGARGGNEAPEVRGRPSAATGGRCRDGDIDEPKAGRSSAGDGMRTTESARYRRQWRITLAQMCEGSQTWIGEREARERTET